MADWDNNAEIVVTAKQGNGADAAADTESQEKYKVEMQKLHMSEENQELIKAALLEIRGDLKLRQASTYRDFGRRLDNGYWLKDNQLLVRGGVDYSQPGQGEEAAQDGAADQSSFGLQKLLGIGFHKSRCVSALARTDGDVGAALELIMAESFGLVVAGGGAEESSGPGDIVASDTVTEEQVPVEVDPDLLEQRNDEKMALESIYETLFVEKIVGKVWELRLTLNHLLKYLPKEAKQKTGAKNGDLKADKNVCPYFLAGYCRFGRRCYKKHVNKEQQRKADDDHLTGKKDEKVFIVELRFPSGSRYPLDPIMVTFSTPLSQFPRTACMKITSRLMEEARSCALEGGPAIFSLVSLLEDVAEMDRVLRAGDHKLSLPRPVGDTMADTQAAGDSASTSEALFSALEKPARAEERNKARQSRMISLNRKMKSNHIKRIVSGEKGKYDDVRKKLPAWQEKDKIVSLLKTNQVVVISGMTGCGKSTQVIVTDWLFNKYY